MITIFSALEQTQPSVNDQKVTKYWDENCTLSDGHYVLPIPWKDRNDPIPNNFWVAKKRLDSLVKRLESETILERYDHEIENMLAGGMLKSSLHIWSMQLPVWGTCLIITSSIPRKRINCVWSLTVHRNLRASH